MQRAEFDDWNKRQLWTIAQAAFVLNGSLPPEPLSVDDIRKAGGDVERAYEELKNAVDLKKFPAVPPRRFPLWVGEQRAEPARIVNWARSFGLRVPSELAGLAETTSERDARLYAEVQAEQGKGNKAFLKTVCRRNKGMTESNLKRIVQKERKRRS